MDILLFGTSILIHRYFQIIKSDNDVNDYQINSNTIGLTFSPTGCLFMYTHGIAAFLEDHFYLTNVIYAGNSGGCQASFFLASGLGMNVALNKWYLPMMDDIIKEDLKHPFLLTSFDKSKKYLRKLIDKDILEKINNRYFTVITHFPYFIPIVNNNYKNFEELFQIIKGTQYIPFIFGWPFLIYKWRLICDGWLSCKIFKPVKNIKWLRIDPFKWKRFKTMEGLTSFKNFHNVSYNLKLRDLGYQDAKNNINEFIEIGLIPKK